MSVEPLLTICIPTYRRPVFLSECLKGLSSEDLSGVEVIARDNCSDDETESVLKSFLAALPLRYEIAQSNEGPERNFERLIRSARGRYVWLLGDDDLVVPGAVAHIKKYLLDGSPLLLQLGYIQGSSSLEPRFDVRPCIPESGTLCVEDLASYIAAQPNVSVLFAFISSFVFLRSCWLQGASAERWYGTHYVHMYQMHAAMVRVGCFGISTLAQPGVIARGEISNAITAKLGEIMWLDARTLADLACSIYGNSPAIGKALGIVFRRTYRWRTICSVLAQTQKSLDPRTRTALIRLGYSPIKLRLATLLGHAPLRRFALTLAKALQR